MGWFSRKKDLIPPIIENVNTTFYSFEEDEEGVISCVFNLQCADRKKGEYYPCTKGIRISEDNRSDRDRYKKFPRYSLYEWSKHSKEFIDENHTVCLIRRNDYDYQKFISNKACILDAILAPKSGVIELLKSEYGAIENGDILFKIYSEKHPFKLINNPENGFYHFYFDKYEIPVELRLLNQQGGDKIYISKWLKKDGEVVNEGDDLLEIEGRDNLNKYFVLTLKSKLNGHLHINKNNKPRLSSREDKLLLQRDYLYSIYKYKWHYIINEYKNQHTLITDEFTGGKTIKWERVGGYIDPLNQSRFNILPLTPLGGFVMSDNSGKKIIVSFENRGVKDYIIFSVFVEDFKLSLNDRIHFLFEDGKIVTFQIAHKPYFRKDLKKKCLVGECLLYHLELSDFWCKPLKYWRVEFSNKSLMPITGDIGHYCYPQSIAKDIFQNYANDYMVLVRKEIPNYDPVIMRPKITDGNVTVSSAPCFVYLMRDTTNNYHKIGISNNPEYREKTLQSEKPAIQMIRAKQYPNRVIAESIEKALHNAYSSKRIRGEWFALNNEDIIAIIGTLK